MKVSYSFILYILLLGFQVPLTLAQTGSLQGKIVARKTGKPLYKANIALTLISENQQIVGAHSAQNGSYEIKNLQPGVFRLTVSYIGYETFSIAKLILGAAEAKKLNISLTEKILEMDPIVVSTPKQSIDRRAIEKLQSTASVTILDSVQIQSVQPMSPADHLLGLSGVDVVKTGISQSNVAIRGFNDLFSSSYLLLVDNRIGRVPSLRFNAYSFIPTSNEDIERIEIIRGPASSLYGPNSANGVLHIVTKSPFETKGTTINVGFGERNTVVADFRNAGRIGNKIAYKITGTLMQGNDFESHDAFEDSVRASLLEAAKFYAERGLPNPIPMTEETDRIGLRDFRVEKLATTAQINYVANPDLMFVLMGGFNLASNMELTQIGAAVVDNWRYFYGQGKILYKNLFLQAFVNASDAGGTYFPRDGGSLVDRSKLFSFQIQNTTELGRRQVFTYGMDALLTRPLTEGSVNGSNEDDDNIDEIGIYLQSESDFSEKIKLVLAGRLDRHNRLDNPFFSPKAGLVFTPVPGNRLRFSFSRAFNTPTTENLFLDRLVSPLIPDQLISFSSFLNFQPFNVRVSGVPKSGFTFKRDTNGGVGGLYMQPVQLYFPQNQDFIPADATLLWDKAIEIITQIEGSGLEPMYNNLRSVPTPNLTEVQSVLKAFNPTTGESELVDPSLVTNIRSLAATKTNSFEFGYKGVWNDRLLINADIYYSRIKDFIGPLLVETPNVFFDRASLEQYLSPFISAAPAFARMMSVIPLGTVTPQQTRYPGDVLLTYKNFGDIDLFGADLEANFLATKHLTLTGTYSFVSKNLFDDVDGVRDIALNAPKNKFSLGVHYRNRNSGIGGGLRFRSVEGFPVNSGIFIGEVDSYGLFDLNAGVDLPGESGIRLALTVQNLFNNKHREFVGAPEVGRLALFQVKYFPDRYQ